MDINGYKLKGELQNANSGFSKWGFATKNGKEYFIKELINPVYPVDRSVMSEEMFLQRRGYCEEYEVKFRRFFGQINKASRGNLVRIEEFFRCGSRYYLVTEKVDGRNIPMAHIASLSKEKKMLLLKTVAQCFCDLHSVGIVHFDVKDTNILLKVTRNGNYAAKLIDFDSGFMKGEPLEASELGGDLVHLAPETFLAIYGEPVRPDEKADIFSLGLLFHEYYCGHLPFYDENEYDYPYEAALDGGVLKIDTDKLPEELGKLIAAMLSAEPKDRPSAEEIIVKLKEMNMEKSASDIKSISARFGGHYGKTISVEPGIIKYRNTIHPAVREETWNFPPSYSMQYEKEITGEQFKDIARDVFSAGLVDLVTRVTENDGRPGAVYQNLTVMFKDETACEYSTCASADSQFEKITEILSRYCDFPEIDSAWYEKTGEERKKESAERVEVARVEPEVRPEPVVRIPEPPPERRSADWFSRAGDL